MGQNHSGNPSKAEILRENVTHNSPILYIHFYSKLVNGMFALDLLNNPTETHNEIIFNL